jgi:ABC-type Fe3+-hydroxamate transport system substrate-binding protein
MKILAVLVLLSACSSTQSPARTAVEVAETSWLLAANACIATTDAAVRAKCTEALIPAHKALLDAAADVDKGGTDYACELHQVADAFALVAGLGIVLPASAVQVQQVAATIPCVSPTDGGAQ